jgi:hypothetical protein
MVEQSENVSEQNFTRCWTAGSTELGGKNEQTNIPR